MLPVAHSDERESLAVEDEFGRYRAVSALAVTGVLLGLFSILAYIHPLLWLVPLVAIIVNVVALRRIAEASPALIGRKAALVGLALSLIFAIAVPIQRAIHRRELRAESLKIAEEWFNGFRDNHPEIAHRLSRYPTSAATRAQSPLKQFSSGMMSQEALRKFVHDSPNELLLKLGKRARVRLLAHEVVWAEQAMEGVRDFYVVTVGNGPETVSFLISLGTTRSKDLATGDWQWQVTKSEFVHVPPPELTEALGG
ncbi:MAG TPA: hypothetical protein VGX78_10755 [Pirellulales bacterium]|jgi:hypothetical protein|nr:hypothetical protein [Pirellulales bacterium]